MIKGNGVPFKMQRASLVPLLESKLCNDLLGEIETVGALNTVHQKKYAAVILWSPFYSCKMSFIGMIIDYEYLWWGRE
jgi:hypothetical protein